MAAEKQLERFIRALVRIGKGNKCLKYPIVALLFVMGEVYDGFCLIGELRRPAVRRRVLAGVMSVCMACTLIPMTAFAEKPLPGASTLCEHHTKHTPECGYIEAVKGAPCGFIPDAPQEASPSDAQGQKTEPAVHIHDEDCGYIEAAEGVPCGFVCGICNAAEEEPAADSGAAEQQDALPSDVMPIDTGWVLDADGLLTISTDAGMSDWDANGKTNEATLQAVKKVVLEEAVTIIPESAFAKCSKLTSVTGDGVAVIEKDAFYNSSWTHKLTTAYFPNAVTIGDRAFYGCCSLTNVNFPKAETIGVMAFYEAKLSKPTFPLVATIGQGAFACVDRNQTSLKSISLPNVTNIGSTAFFKCKNLAELSLPATPPVTEKNAFNSCANSRILKFVDENGTELTDKTAAVKAYSEAADAADGLWYGWIINKPVDRITVRTDDAETILSSSLQDAVGSKMTTLNKLEIIGGSFLETDWNYLKKLTALETFIMADTVEKVEIMPQAGINERLFPQSIKSVSIQQAGITALSNYAFYECANLTDTDFPTITKIGNGTFSDCTSLASVSLPKVTFIDEVAFYKCTALMSLSLPANPPKVGWNLLFDHCPDARELSFIAEDGTKLAGSALNAAVAAYKAVDDSVTDDLWYGWKMETPPDEARWTVGGETKSGTFAEALNAMNAKGGSIKLLTAVSTASGIVLPAKAIALDLNGQVWSSEWKINVPNGCVMTVTDSAGTGGGITVTAVSESGVEVASGGTLDLRSGSITCSAGGSAGISNYGTLKLSGSGAVSAPAYAVRNNGTMYLSGAPALTSGSNYSQIVMEAGAALIANDGNAGSPSYSAGNISVLCPSSSVAGYVAVSGLKDAEHAKLFTFNSITGLVFAYDDSTKSIKLEAPSVDKGWTIDDAGNLIVSTAAGMSDWKTNGLAANKATLKTVTIDKTVTEISSQGFEACTALTTVTASGVTRIASYAFDGCSSLATLSLPAEPPSVDDENAFKKCPPNRALALVDTNGKALTGTALTDAQAAYNAVDDGVTTDNLWYGWKTGTPPPAASTVTSVEVTPAAVTTKSGSIQQFTAVVNGENSPAQTVKWTVEGTQGSSIDGRGELNVVSSEPDGTLIVRATSVADPSKSGTAAVTVSNKPAAISHTITASADAGGTISPSGSVSVGTGKNQTFTITASHGYRISSVMVDGVNQGAVGTYTFNNVTGDHTISATFSGVSSSSGGGNGGGSSGGGTAATPVPSEKEKPSRGESTVTAPVDENGNASVTVSDQTVTDAINEAKKDAAQGQPISVYVKVETDKAATQITATLPQAVQETLISSKVNSVTIASNTVTISFNQTAIQQMNGQAKADIIITAAKVDTGKLTGDAKTLIGSRPMYDFTAIYGGNQTITSFGDNTVSIAIPYALENGEAAGNIQAVYVDDGGKATVITNSSYDTNQKAVIFTTSHFSGYGVGYMQTTPVFHDIASHWAKTDIEFVASRGLLFGTGDKTFSPDTAMTRGIFAEALGKMAGIDLNSYQTGTFNDVKADASYAPYVTWAASKNIVSGTSATTFAPDQAITRQEMAVIMQNYAKAMGYTVPKAREAVIYADNSSIASWAAEAVKSMQTAGVIMGKDENKFDPTGTATRAEVSAVLRRYVELVIDSTTAQGLDINDSGKIVCYENGRLFTGTKTDDGMTYHFGSDGICTNIDAVVPDTRKYFVHKIVKGDTLWAIAVKNKCTVAEIVALNGIKNPDNIEIGAELKIPQK